MIRVRPIDSRDRVSSRKCRVSFIEGRLRLFDDQDRGIVEVGARERDPELFVGLEVVAERPDHRVVTVRKVLNEVVGMGDLGGLDDPRQGVHRVAQADIYQDRVGEDQVGLQDGGDLGANRVDSDVAEVVAVDQDAAGPRVDQAGNQAGQGELRVVVLAHDGGARAGGDLDRDTLEQPAPRAALELDVLDADLVLESVQEMCADVLVKLGPPLEKLEDCREPSDWRGESLFASEATRRSDKPAPRAKPARSAWSRSRSAR